MSYSVQVIKTFWTKVDRKGDNECWIYKSNSPHVGRKISYYYHFNEIHDTINIYTSCRNKKCVNPRHLKLLRRDEILLTESQADPALLALFNALDVTDEIRERYVRSPFGYPGGKSRSLEHILPNLPYRDGYGEAFGGSGSVLLARHASDLEIYNDRFGGVTCFYRVLRDPAKLYTLMERLNLTVYSREEFLWCKETWEGVDDEIERAARWFYMHQASFTRQERNFGRATSGKGRSVTSTIRDNLQFFEPCHHRLKYVLIENLDWRQFLKDFDNPGMVFYLDPPYLKYSVGMYKHVMTQQDHIEMCERIFQLQGFVALSGYGDDQTRSIYGRYPWDDVKEWKTINTMTALATTETNQRSEINYEIERLDATELLFIKEAK